MTKGTPYTEDRLPCAPTCFTCPYWERDEGLCRRHAPQPRVLHEAEEGSSEPLPSYASVDAIGHCGEHPLMPDYIALLRRVGVLRLGAATRYGSDDAGPYCDWAWDRMVETLGGLCGSTKVES